LLKVNFKKAKNNKSARKLNTRENECPESLVGIGLQGIHFDVTRFGAL
jgi:hypothetical protein